VPGAGGMSGGAGGAGGMTSGPVDSGPAPMPPSVLDAGIFDVFDAGGGEDAGAGPKVLSMRWVDSRTGQALGTQLSRAQISAGVALDVQVEPTTWAVTYNHRDSILTESVAPYRWCGSMGNAAAPCLPSLFTTGPGQIRARAFDRAGILGPLSTLAYTVVEGGDAGVVVMPPADAGMGATVQLAFVNRLTQAKTPLRSGDAWPTPVADYAVLLDQPAVSARFEIVDRGFIQNEGRLPHYMCGDELDTGPLACSATVLAAGTIELRVTVYDAAMQTGNSTTSLVSLRIP
jgi:hypothetical protein